MEFNEKLRELRKGKSLTQEELAEALYVSRTAVSKWESGRGYPSIDSLKEMSRFFSVTIDELVTPDEIVEVAQDDKRAFADKYSSLVSGMLDILLALLLFVPVFGNGSDIPLTVSLLALTGVSPWVRITFLVVVVATILCGLCEVVVSSLDKPNWCGAMLAASVVLSTVCVAVFIVARQPYAGIVSFALLVTKTLLLFGRARKARRRG